MFIPCQEVEVMVAEMEETRLLSLWPQFWFVSVKPLESSDGGPLCSNFCQDDVADYV